MKSIMYHYIRNKSKLFPYYNILEKKAFSPIPKAIIHLTHDVDAVSKTIAIRSKQAIFSLYNGRVKAAVKFLFSYGNYWQFEKITNLEDNMIEDDMDVLTDDDDANRFAGD